jgi:hypothetical protein
MFVTISNDVFGGRVAFERAISRAQRGKVKSLLTKSSRRLCSLEGRLTSGHYLGLLEVPIDQIRGTEGRQSDFDIEFNPLRKASRDRWVGVFNAWMRGIALGSIQLVKVGNIYYVRDGHHRISVARALGQRFIEAEVIYFE